MSYCTRLFFLILLPLVTLGQRAAISLPNGYYVTIRSFADYYDAETYSDNIFKLGYHDTGFGYDEENSRYIVYLFASSNAEEAEREKNNYISSERFPGAIIRHITTSFDRAATQYTSNVAYKGNAQPAATTTGNATGGRSRASNDISANTSTSTDVPANGGFVPLTSTASNDQNTTVNAASVARNEYQSETTIEEESSIQEEVITETTVVDPEQDFLTSDASQHSDLEYIYIKPVTYNARTNEVVESMVDFVDAERARRITENESSEVFKIESGQTEKLKLIVDRFGYRKVEYDMNLNNPMGANDGMVEQDGDTLVVSLGLERLRKGEVLVMYNVFFWSDAAVMKETSLYELNELLQMLEENEAYEIRINGHTNGNSAGRIYTVEEGSTDYFNRNPSNDQSTGSAKKLSEERADVIKKWLVLKGIGENRIETKGWGGRKPIYDTKSPNAARNLRVEVEVLKDGSENNTALNP